MGPLLTNANVDLEMKMCQSGNQAALTRFDSTEKIDGCQPSIM